MHGQTFVQTARDAPGGADGSGDAMTATFGGWTAADQDDDDRDDETYRRMAEHVARRLLDADED